METNLALASSVSDSSIISVDSYPTAASSAKTVHDLIDIMAEADPESLYLVSPENGQGLSFRDLQERVRQLSAKFREEGLTRGEKVAFLMDNGLFSAQLFLGAMYGGFVSVPLNVNAGVSQLAYMIDHCDAGLIFVSKEYAALINEVVPQVRRQVRVITSLSWSNFEAAEPDPSKPIPPAPEPEDEALLIYSSGSTGRPRGAVHSHRALLAAARNSVRAHQLTAADRSLLVLPLYHINAECVTLMPTLLSGGSVIIPNRFSVSRFWDWLDEYGCTWSAVVPTIISQLLDWRDPKAGNRQGLFNRLRFLRSSSAPLAPSLHREFMERFKILLIQAMGSSEAGNIFSNPLPPGENKIGSPGLPWGFEAKVINRDNAELAPGEPGEILLRGPAMMHGYYKEPEETAAVLDADGWLHTGDLAYRDADGYFFVVGRSKELIIKGGVNIAPRQIDDVLEAHPAVLEAAAVGVPDHHLGEDVIGFVVLRAGAIVTERELLTFCESRLGHFKTPTRIHFAADLPKGPSGKVQRLKLREAQATSLLKVAIANDSGQTVGQNGSADSAVLERILFECWAEVLETQNIDLESNFFALGGHSLLAVQCLSRLRDRVPVALSLSDFFDNGTIAKQAALIIHRLHLDGQTEGQLLTATEGRKQLQIGLTAKQSSIPLRDRTVPCPLSPGQRRLWFTELLSAGVPLYNESEAVRLVGQLDINALESAFRAIVFRHEILRTTIQVQNQEPFAVVNEEWRPHLKTIDLSALSPSDRQVEVDRLLVEEPTLPFHLESEPGIRLTLICLGPTEQVLILMMHHIICDWASEGIFWREFASAYRSFRNNTLLALPALAMQFGDFATWRGQEAAQADFADDMAYWEDNLQGAPEVLDLPADRPRPAVLSNRGSRLRLRLDPALTRAVRELSQRTETTLFTIFAAALNVLLYRYSGKEDILLGLPIADRDLKEQQGLIGFLLHVQALRTRLSGDTKFQDLLGSVQRQALALYEHRAVPFEQIVKRIHPERSLSYSPLFQVMLIWRDRDQMLEFIGLEDLQIESLLSESKTSKLDLTFFATDRGEELWLDLEYSTDLFDEGRMARMLGHYRTILESVTSNPDLGASGVPILTEAEREQILIDFNRTEVPFASECRLHDLFVRQAKQTPDAIAVSHHGNNITYRELDRRSTQLAHHLRGLGVRPEALTAICMERSIQMTVALLGILKAGGAYLPVDPSYPSDRISFTLEDSGAGVLIAEQKLAGTIPMGSARIIRIDADWPVIEQADDSAIDDGATPDNAAYVIYTSGSTGRPKGVVIPHRAVVNFMLSMSREPGLNSNDVLVAVTTLAFDIAALELFLPLTVGARVEIASREDALDPGLLASLLRKSQATVMQATPATWRMLIDSGWDGNPALKILCGGEALSQDLASQLLKRAREVWNMYGPTETTIWSTIERVSSGDTPVSIGRPIANTQVYVLDDKLEPMPVGITGELFLAGAGLARGYLNQPQLTSERFVRNPFFSAHDARMYRTGDLARFHEDGRIECLGRVDDQVKIRGFRIELGEIEAVLRRHPGVRETVVVAHGDDSEDKRLIAYFTPSDPQLLPEPQALRDFLKQALPDYMVPGAFIGLDVFPKTPNGKIDRHALTIHRHVSTKRSSEASFVAPRTPGEFLVLEIWQRVLGIRDMGVRDNFFELGGDSLLAVRLLGEISKALGVNIPIPSFFLSPTIEGIGQVFDQKNDTQFQPRLIPLRGGRSEGAVFFIDASMGMCRLGTLLEGPASFATTVPLPAAVIEKVLNNRWADVPRIEVLAVPHTSMIRSQTFERCVLVGWSYRALLALEVAHQLRGYGRQVDLIVLDGIAPLPWYDRLKKLTFSRLRWALNRRMDGAKNALAKIAFSLGLHDRPNPPGLALEVERPAQQLDMLSWRVHFNAIKYYRCRPMKSRGILVRATAEPKYEHFKDMGWGAVFGDGLEIVDVHSDHLSLFNDPHLGQLAEILQDWVDRSMNTKA